MQVGPQYLPRHLVARVQHMVVVVPVDADIDEAQHIAQENRDQRCERIDALAMRHLELQHHDGDDDGDHAIAECFESAFAHSVLATETQAISNSNSSDSSLAATTRSCSASILAPSPILS